MSLKPPDSTTNTFDAIANDAPFITSSQNVLDLRDYYAGNSQPSDVLGHIQDGLADSALLGGSLLIPDSIEPWEVSGPIIPPPNSRMHGPPGGGRFSERQTNGGHSSTAHYTLPTLPNHIGEAWIKLKAGSNCPILMNDYDNSHGLRGPDRGNGAYWQWFCAERIRFDHNGRNQTMSTLGAIYFQDAWGMELVQCGLVSPRYRGYVASNCNSCNTEKFSCVGDFQAVADGTGVLNATTTITSATGTWAIGDFISGTGVVSGSYLTNVVGATLTLNTAATGTGSATLSHIRYITDDLMVLEDSTVDSEHIGASCHAARLSGLLLDSCYGTRVSGLFGYTIGGHNVWLRNTMTASSHYVGGCKNNYVSVRCDAATKHNVRIDNGCVDNVVEAVSLGCGILNTPNDADAGWASIYCDGQSNLLRGTGAKSTSTLSNMSAVVAYGPNAVDNIGAAGGGSDLPATFPLYSYRPAVPGVPVDIFSNTSPVSPKFFLPGYGFEPVDGSGAVKANFNGSLHKVMTLSDAVTDSVITYFTVPQGCRRLLIRPIFVNLNSGVSGNVRVQAGFSDYSTTGNTPGADEAVLGPITIAIGANSQTVATTFSGVQTPVVPGLLCAIRIKRIGADAADTLAASIGLMGVEIEPLLVGV